MKIDRLFVVSLGAITGLASCSSGQEEEAQRPNILILLADDAGYADFGFMGATDIQTPNIDRLAAEGCIFTDAHVAATVSSPSRSMMLTGRYGQRYGYECNLDKPGDGLPDDEELLPALLKRYDYRTGCIGKWHLGSEPSQRPNAKGFDTFYGLLAGHRSYFYDPETSDKDGNLQQYQYNGRKLSFDGYFTDELASKAQQFVKAGRSIWKESFVKTHVYTDSLPARSELCWLRDYIVPATGACVVGYYIDTFFDMDENLPL